MIILTNFIKIFNLFKVNKNKLFPFFNMSKIWPKNWIMWQKHGSHWQIIILIIMITMIIRKWFEPRSNIPWLKKIIWSAEKDCCQRLWRWLPHRLSKHQSLTRVLLRTPMTQMIFFNQGIKSIVMQDPDNVLKCSRFRNIWMKNSLPQMDQNPLWQHSVPECFATAVFFRHVCQYRIFWRILDIEPSVNEPHWSRKIDQ